MRDDVASVLKVGFVGLGDQGAPMAQAFLDGGFELNVWARRPASVAALHGSPRVHESANELASTVDVLLLCLPDDSDVRFMLDGGLGTALRPGSVLVNTGTGVPAWSAEVAEGLAADGPAFLDAPVSGGGPGAGARSLTTMVGGDADAYERCVAIFETFSKSVYRMGSAGSGQTAKLLNNALTMANLDNAADILQVTRRLPVDIPAFLKVLSHSSGGSFILDALNAEVTLAIAPHLQSLMHKDIEHFAEAVSASGLDARVLTDRGHSGAGKLVAAVALVAESVSGDGSGWRPTDRASRRSAASDDVPNSA